MSSAPITEKLPSSECSICADGSAPSVSNSSATFPVSSTVRLSCSELPTNAISSVYQQGVSNSDYQCAVSQLWAYEYCGCPTPPDIRDCWICKDGDTNYQKDTWVPTSSAPEGTCQFQAFMSGITYDYFGRATDQKQLKCPYLTWGMDTWCGCPEETVSLPECHLCGSNQMGKLPCRRNPLAPLLHTAQSSLGINFGTCQYYDWLVERLNPAQCGIYELDSTVQFDGFDVQGFCCDEEAVLVSGITLCLEDADLVANQWVPELQASCQEIHGVVQHLKNDTVLVEPLQSTGMSLRDYCCNAQPNAETQLSRATCEVIPRIEYESTSSGRRKIPLRGLSTVILVLGFVWSPLLFH